MVRDKCEGRLAGIKTSDITTPPTYTIMNSEVCNHRFVSRRGNHVEVFNVRSVETRNGFGGFGRVVRTFVRVCGREFEVTTGCSFRSSSVVHENGF